jgi:hypothetical protein
MKYVEVIAGAGSAETVRAAAERAKALSVTSGLSSVLVGAMVAYVLVWILTLAVLTLVVLERQYRLLPV